MKNRPEKRRATKAENTSRASETPKRDKRTGKKSAKMEVAHKGFKNNEAPRAETVRKDNEALHQPIRFIVGWFPISLVVILLALSPFYFLSRWFFELFLDDLNTIFNLITGLFVIFGGIVGWNWNGKKSWVAASVGALIGYAIPFVYLQLEFFGSF